MVDVTPGDLGANKGFWMTQLRDRFGKFVEMGGSVMFDVQLEGVNGIVQGIGKFIGNAEPGLARIEVTDNSRIPKGVYLVKSEDITAIEAVLPATYVEEKLDRSPLKKSMSGSEALDLRLKSMGSILREDGRFPVPRMSFLDRDDSDNRRAAKRDYRKVFDAEPALQEKYKTFENMWQMVYRYGTDERTQSPNVLADIPEDMKELNRAYAKHFLGLEPDGLITVYRNAVNGKDTEQESAVGYASLDASMAYDYASHRDNVAANGRYEIDIKPDEVFGMLGYSKIEDEYGVTIGRELANIPGRVRRVGDLAMVLPEAPWLKEWGLGFNRGKGASPFRQYSLAVSHDFHPVEPFGDSLEEFFTKYNLSAADIKNKYDEIYGEGAYEEYKATGNTVKFNKLRDLFVTLPDGKLGLDLKKVENLSALREVSEYKGDSFDNTMKMLSVFQELTGQYFMTHRTRDYTPPPAEAEPRALGATTWINPPTEAQLKALEDYGSGELADSGNTYLRTGDLPAPYAREEGEPESMADFKAQLRAEVEQQIQDLSSAFENSVLNQDVTVYRSLEDPSFNFESNLELKDGESLDLSYLEGTIYSDKGFMSTSKTTNFAFDARNLSTRFIIKAKAGQKAIDLLGAIRFDALAREEEIIFPPDAQFKISKAYYSNEDGKYYIEMDYVDEQDSIYEEFFDAGNIDLQSLARTVDGVPKYDREMFTDEQLRALETYGQSGYRQINALLRQDATLTADQKNLIKLIDEAIDENGALFSPGRVYRGDLPKSDSDYAKFLQNMEVGGTYRFPGYFSASNDAQIAFSEFGPGVGSGDSDGSATHLGSSFFWSVDVPEDGRAMAMPDDTGFGQGAESEVVLPRGSNLKILGIKKVEQIDDEGHSNGNFNYFIHAEQLSAPYLGEQGSSGNDSTDYASIDYETSEFKDVAELQVITEEDLAALSYYTGEDVAVYGVGYDKINEFLRNKEWGSDVQTPEEQQRILKIIQTLKKIVNSTTIDKDIKVIRYQKFILDGASKPGDIWTSDGFLSTATMTDGGEEVYNAFTGGPVEIEINIPKGSRGGAVPDSVEAEVLLPPGSRFIVQSVEKVNFRETKIKLLLVGQDG